MEKIIITAMLVLMTGCAGKMIVDGHPYPTNWVKTVEEVDKSTVEEKNASLAIVNSTNGKRGAVTITYINTQYLTKQDTAKNTSAKRNQVDARLAFNQKVEMVRKRNGVDVKYWKRDVYIPALKDHPLADEVCKTFWSPNLTVTSIVDNIEYSKSIRDYPAENNIVYSKDFKNFSVLTDSTIIGILYTDKAKELPLEDVCSVKSAELFLVELAKDVAAKTAEYINK